METAYQGIVSNHRGLPVDDKGASSSIQTVTGETVQLYYYNSGVLTADAGEAAGTVVVGQLANQNIRNALGSMQATHRDTSLSFTSTALTTEVTSEDSSRSGFVGEDVDPASGEDRANRITAGLANGEYLVDYASGTIYGKKADTSTTLTSTTYKVGSNISGGGGGVSSEVDVTKVGGEAIATDDSAMAETPKFMPVGGEYRASDTTYADGDATVLQTDINGKLKTSGSSGGSSAGGSGIIVGYEGGSYVFDASAQTITFSGLGTITLERILLVTNVTDQEIIYNPSDPALGGSMTSNVLTLEYDTTSMADGDSLQIYLQYNNSEDYSDGVTKASVQNPLPANFDDTTDLITAAQNLTSSFEDCGGEIPAKQRRTLYVPFILDGNDSRGVKIKVLFKDTSAGANEYVYEPQLWTVRDSSLAPDGSYRLLKGSINDSLDGPFVVVIETNNIPGFFQIQVMADTVGGTAGQIDEATKLLGY